RTTHLRTQRVTDVRVRVPLTELLAVLSGCREQLADLLRELLVADLDAELRSRAVEEETRMHVAFRPRTDLLARLLLVLGAAELETAPGELELEVVEQLLDPVLDQRVGKSDRVARDELLEDRIPDDGVGAALRIAAEV